MPGRLSKSKTAVKQCISPSQPSSIHASQSTLRTTFIVTSLCCLHGAATTIVASAPLYCDVFFLSATTFIFTFLAVRSQCDRRSCQTACCSNWMTRHSSFVHSEETSIVQHEGVHEQYLETLFGCRLFHTL